MPNLGIWWLFATIVLWPSFVSAETLEQVLISVYKQNPRILAARASLRALDEDVARANSGYRPIVTGNADWGYQNQNNTPESLGSSGHTNPRGYGVGAVQSVFNGFQTANRVKTAEASVRSTQAALVSLEQQVLLETIAAYFDVLRDGAIVRLQQGHLSYLASEVAATRRRKEEGQVTRTDLSQALARRAAAATRLQSAHGSVQISLANYERLVGRPPSNLSIPSRILFDIPSSLAAANATALKVHPDVLSAIEDARAAEFTIRAIRGELLPRAQIDVDYSRDYEPSTFTNRSDTLIARGRVTVPIYSGGEVEARVRQAKHTEISRLQTIKQIRLQTTSNVEQAWAQMQVSKAQQRNIEIEVTESRRALDGVRKEERFSQRTVADVLSAADALVNAEVSLASNNRAVVVSSYAVIAAIGKLNMDNLKLLAVRYDPQVNYDATHRRWGGLSITYRNGRKEVVH